MTCIAPSKTFNLAGMQSSCIFIPDEEKRGIYMTQLLHTAQSNRLNVLGYKSTELACTRCDGWLEECIQLLVRNRKAVEDFIEKELPRVKVTPLEGTYLMWLDCGGWELIIRNWSGLMWRRLISLRTRVIYSALRVKDLNVSILPAPQRY